MPEDMMVPAGPYKLPKQFRREQMRRQKKDMPWTKRIFDMDEKKLFGRTALGWMRITMFYLVLFILILLIALFWIFLFKFLLIPKDRPLSRKKWPGVSLVPHNESTLVFHPAEPTTIYPIADKIENFLLGMKDNAIDYFSDFNEDELWGYRSGKPTVFVRLNKVHGFKPDTYDTPDELPSDAPAHLEDVIRKHGGTPRIWVSFTVRHGPSPTAVYYPGPFFDASERMTGVQRVVAVQLNNFPANEDVEVDFKVWARNIPIEDRYNGKGHAKVTLQMNMQSALKETMRRSHKRVNLGSKSPSF